MRQLHHRRRRLVTVNDRLPGSTTAGAGQSGWTRHPSKSAGYTSDPRWKRLRRKVLKRDGGMCQIRGPRCIVTATAVDKIRPAAQGGDGFDPDNLQAVCRPCHDAKTAGEAIAGRASTRGKRRPPLHPADALGALRALGEQ